MGRNGPPGTAVRSALCPAAIPAAGPDFAGFAKIPLNVGKKAKGKVVGWDSLSATYTLTSGVGFVDSVGIKVIAPNGRTVELVNDRQSAAGLVRGSAGRLRAALSGLPPPPRWGRVDQVRRAPGSTGLRPWISSRASAVRTAATPWKGSITPSMMRWAAASYWTPWKGRTSRPTITSVPS